MTVPLMVSDYDPHIVPPTAEEERIRVEKLAAKNAAPKSRAEKARDVYLAMQQAIDARLVRFAPLIQASASKSVTVGSEWWYEPSLAGHEDFWKPDIVRVVELVTAPMPASSAEYPAPPARQYIVRLPGGTQLFANDTSLFYINPTRTGPRE